MLIRTAERKAGREFRGSGAAPKVISDSVELYLSTPRSGSFAVTFRVGRQQEQIEDPELSGTTALIDEMLECLELYEEGHEAALRERIGDELYYNNFTAIAKQLGPDGEDVNFVGFTAERYGRRTTLRLERIPAERRKARLLPVPPSHVETVTGRLLFADELHGQNTIRLLDEHGHEHKISVPPGMMSDIVKPLWEDLVTVTGIRRYKTIHLIDIQRTGTADEKDREVADGR